MAKAPVFLPNDNTLDPSFTNPPGLHYVFTFPGACTLTKAALHGKSASIGSTNTLLVGGVPQDTDFVVFVNGVQSPALFTLLAGVTDVDLSAAPNISIPAGAEVMFAFIADPASDSGVLQNFLLSYSVGPP
jgi:hypothetical protein